MSGDLLLRARDDVGVFAEALAGAPLWPHQLEVARSPARIRCMLTGRQAGKSRTLAVLALHQAFTVPGSTVLVVSAGEDAAKDLLAEVSALASSPLLGGSVVDELKSQLTLSTGSTIRSIPASQKQARGKSVDLLVLDEAAFIDDSIWTAAKYTMIARPGSRVVMTSTPWGRKDRFFAVAYRAGLNGVDGYASWHWPSTVSPMVDEDLLAMWRATSTDREYRQEVLAEWVDDSGAYFPAEVLATAIEEGYEMLPPAEAFGFPAIAGCDWGFARDASTCVLLCDQPVDGEPDGVWWVPWLIERFETRYSDFIEEVAGIACGFDLGRVTSEQNGVGAMPSQELTARLERLRVEVADASGYGAHPCRAFVAPVNTTAAMKEDGFGALQFLMREGRLALPRHPGLLQQLSALEFEVTESGSMHIAVPERAGGHDDLAMGLLLAAWGAPGPAGPRPRGGSGRIVNVGAAG